MAHLGARDLRKTPEYRAGTRPASQASGASRMKREPWLILLFRRRLVSRRSWASIGFLAAVGCGGRSIQSSPTDGAAPETGETSSDIDGGCIIQASSYDQSCTVDSDCVSVAGGFPVASGDYCQSSCLCPDETISRGAAAQFASAVSRTPLGSGALPHLGCNCGASLGPCCVAGQCSTSCLPETSCSEPPV